MEFIGQISQSIYICKIVFILVTYREKMTIWIGGEEVLLLELLVLDLKLIILPGNLAKVSCTLHSGNWN